MSIKRRREGIVSEAVIPWEGGRPHRRLIVWQKAVEMVKEIYQLAGRFPKDEKVLADQMRRAAVSIPSNIAEGAARFSNKEKLNFFHIARGSLSELDTQLEIAFTLSFLSLKEKANTQARLEQLMAMLNGLIASRRVRS
jgi:four helix bundle protein